MTDTIPSDRQQALRTLLSTYPVRLRIARALIGISRDQLAERAGLSSQIVSELERGRRHPFAREARALADALVLPIDFFRGSAVSSEALLRVISGETDARAWAVANEGAR